MLNLTGSISPETDMDLLDMLALAQSQRDIMANLINLAVNHEEITLAPTSKTQAHEFICNSVVSNDSIITPSKRFDDTFLGYNVYSCDMSEFIKSGGAVKCLTLKL